MALDRQDDRALVVVPGGDLVGMHAVEHAAELFEPDRRAVPVRDDERPVGGGVRELARRLDVERLVLSINRAGREVDVGLGDRVLDLVDADAERRHGARVELDAHGVLLRSEDLHLGDAADRRDALRQVRLGVFVHGVQRQRRRAEREVQDRLVGVGMLGGRRGTVAAIAAWMSWAAPSMFRSRVKTTVI
jgi:hypothetical protein